MRWLLSSQKRVILSGGQDTLVSRWKGMRGLFAICITVMIKLTKMITSNFWSPWRPHPSIWKAELMHCRYACKVNKNFICKFYSCQMFAIKKSRALVEVNAYTTYLNLQGEIFLENLSVHLLLRLILKR